MEQRIDICFVAGFERRWRWPRPVARSGFSHRLAVVQETRLAGCPEMYFDPTLMRALLDFARRYRPGGRVVVADVFRDIGRFEQPLDTWCAGWEAIDGNDRDPPQAVTVWGDDRRELCIFTEYWTHVGGPRPYADSYTYSVLSKRSLDAELPAFLAAHPLASGWRVVPAVLDQPTSVEPPPATARAGFARLFG